MRIAQGYARRPKRIYVVEKCGFPHFWQLFSVTNPAGFFDQIERNPTKLLLLCSYTWRFSVFKHLRGFSIKYGKVLYYLVLKTLPWFLSNRRKSNKIFTYCDLTHSVF
eukprot:UN24625